MTSCSLTRIEGLLRVRGASEGNGPFYRTFTASPSISLLSQRDPREFPYGTKRLGFTFCHDIWPKVPIATYGLPKNLARLFVKKSARFACFSRPHGRFYVAKWQGYGSCSLLVM
jgi:hypothetical protein